MPRDEPGAHPAAEPRGLDHPAFEPRELDHPAAGPREVDHPAAEPREVDHPASAPRELDHPALGSRGVSQPAEPRDLAELVARLRAAGCVFAEDEAALLISSGASGDALEAMVARRVAGEPLEQVLGWASFDGLRIRVAPGVFVPRRRSELLVRESVRLLSGLAAPVVVDLCCGTGALGAAIVARRPDADVHAADLDPDAVGCARLNLPNVYQGDLFAALPARLRGAVDLVVVNAPYVPTDAIALMPPEARDHEHRVALDGGVDGLDLHRRVADDVAAWLSPSGAVVIETSERQAEQTWALLVEAGLTATVVRDDDLDGTAAIGRRRT